MNALRCSPAAARPSASRHQPHTPCAAHARPPLRCAPMRLKPEHAPDAPKQAQAPALTLYERIGGGPAVSAAVELFYKRVLEDKELAPFFEGISMERQKAKQVKFITFAFGGAPAANAKSDGVNALVAAHVPLMRSRGLNLSHFDAVAGHLTATLEVMGVEPSLVKEADAVVQSTRPLFDPETMLAKHPQ